MLPPGVSSPNERRWLRLLCLSIAPCLMRCQPLRRALTHRNSYPKFT
ncbi:exlusion protein FxsA [Vibrio fluvialis]|uniref:Exlusion protein FxsA n=1 Tax=Vibrio fluvialis TaxID=676 RepID=A0ABM6RLS9_VIBFL|nr:exlusion protein FxsA [Vibrio fluvialis]EKO3993940.1 exlusion protein FxsA [Vibrio fluvialis]EKO4010928.1 exlusion protein FxsA [Vibrio fluvialis]